jgi:hypothetical protein
MVRSMTARPDARGAGEGIPFITAAGRTAAVSRCHSPSSLTGKDGTPARQRAARQRGRLAAGPRPAEGVFAREQTAGITPPARGGAGVTQRGIEHQLQRFHCG